MVIISIRKEFYSLRWTLFFTYVAVGIIPLLIFSTITFRSMEKYYMDERKKELLSQANVVSGHITISNYMFDESKKAIFEYDVAQSSKQGGYRVLVIDSSGVVINDSNNTEEGKTYLIPEVVEALDAKDVSRLQSNGFIYTAVSVLDGNSKRVGVVLTSANTIDITNNISAIKRQTYTMLFAVVFVVGMAMFVFSRAFTKPIKDILDVIKKMSEGYFKERVEVNKNSHSEVAELGIAFNNMAEKLEEVEVSRQEFVSNVSHELKTPLSSIKVLSESILFQSDVPKETYDEFLQDIISEVDRMAEIINDLLNLVKLNQKEMPIEFVEQSLNGLVTSIIKRLEPLSGNKNITIEYKAVKEVLADMDSTKLSLAISNLIDNAFRYTPEGGKVTVTVDCDHQNAFVTVADTGVGIAEESISKIFDRFYRVDKNRDRHTGGTGLGLSITHSTVLMHNGSIKVTSKEDEGSVFVIRIPIRQGQRPAAAKEEA